MRRGEGPSTVVGVACIHLCSKTFESGILLEGSNCNILRINFSHSKRERERESEHMVYKYHESLIMIQSSSITCIYMYCMYNVQVEFKMNGCYNFLLLAVTLKIHKKSKFDWNQLKLDK